MNRNREFRYKRPKEKKMKQYKQDKSVFLILFSSKTKVINSK